MRLWPRRYVEDIDRQTCLALGLNLNKQWQGHVWEWLWFGFATIKEKK